MPELPTASQAVPEGPRTFRPDVEGLRAVAILLVVLYHAGVRFVSGGYVGVDVFFVISGFLITRQLTRELGERHRISLPKFYARRARRILPAATLTIASTVVVATILMPPLTARRVYGDAIAATLFGANFHFAAQGSNYFFSDLAPSPLQHFWSLSVEEQFYFVWPALLLVSSLVWVRRRTERAGRPATASIITALGVVAVVSFAANLLQTQSSPSWAYYSILTRAWELAVGALVGVTVAKASRLGPRAAAGLSWAGLVAIVVAAATYSDTTPYPGTAALLPVLGAAAVVVGGSAARRSRASAELLLGTQPGQKLGAWSYSWYLWHWPALVFAPLVIGHNLSVGGQLLVVLVALGIAILSYTFVERPIRRLQIMVRRPALGLASGASLGMCSLVVVALAGASLPSLQGTGAAVELQSVVHHTLTPGQLTTLLEQGLQKQTVPSDLTPSLTRASGDVPVIVANGCHLETAGTSSKPCIYGDTHDKSAPSVVLFGDSHAAAWFPALDKIAIEHKWRLVDLTKAGCPPVEVSITRGATPYAQCDPWRQNSLSWISKHHPALVVLSWARYLEYPEATSYVGPSPAQGTTIWDQGVRAVFKFLHGHASHVLFISDTPQLEQLDPNCVSAHEKDVRVCTTSWKQAIRLPAVKATEIHLAKSAAVNEIDPDTWFCVKGDACPVIVGQYLLYRDNAHMVPEWSRFIAPVLAAKVVPIMGS